MALVILICLSPLLLLQEALHDDPPVPAYKETGLPVAYVTTQGLGIDRQQQTVRIRIESEADTLDEQVSISLRGNYTATLPKKPYNLKFETKQGLLGMKKARKYALLANACDYTLLRTALGFKLGELLGYEWPLHGRYVELVVDSVHQGNYFLAERVTASKNRVDIDPDTGCILEFMPDDRKDDQQAYFVTDRLNYCIEFKDPDKDDVPPTMRQHAADVMNRFEQAVLGIGKSAPCDWKDLVDLDNFALWYYWKNVLQMYECNRYYVIEDDAPDVRLKMGPLWDFDWSVGMCIYEHLPYQRPMNKLYFGYITDDPEFMARVARLHFSLRDVLERQLLDYYDSTARMIAASSRLDAERWGTFDALDTTLDEEIRTDRAFLQATFQWLDKELSQYLDPEEIDGIQELRPEAKAECYTLTGTKVVNPTRPGIYIQGGRKTVIP